MNRPTRNTFHYATLLATAAGLWVVYGSPALRAQPEPAPAADRDGGRGGDAAPDAAPGAAPGAAADTAPSGTSSAERVLRIVWDREASPPDVESLVRRLKQWEVEQKLGEQILGVEDDAAVEYVQVETVGAEPQENTLVLRLIVQLPENAGRPGGPRLAAREFIDALVARVPVSLRQVREEALATAAAELENQVETLVSEFRRKRADLLQLLTKLRLETGLLAGSPEAVEARMAKLDAEREALSLEQIGAAARAAALQEAVAEVTDRGEAKVGGDEVLVELTRVADLRAEQLQRIRKLQEARSASQENIDEATAALAEARARVAVRRQELLAAGENSSLSEWNRELLTLNINERERKARLQALEERTEHLRGALRLLDEVEATEQDLRSLEEALREADGARQEASRRGRRAGRDFVVVGESNDFHRLSPPRGGGGDAPRGSGQDPPRSPPENAPRGDGR